MQTSIITNVLINGHSYSIKVGHGIIDGEFVYKVIGTACRGRWAMSDRETGDDWLDSQIAKAVENHFGARKTSQPQPQPQPTTVDALPHAKLELSNDQILALIDNRLDSRLSCRVDSQDILQEVLLECWKRSITSASGIRCIVRDKIIEAYRKHMRSSKRSVLASATIDENFDKPIETTDIVETLELAGIIKEKMKLLNREDNRIIQLRIEIGLSNKQVSERMDITEANAAMKYKRAIDSLRELCREFI